MRYTDEYAPKLKKKLARIKNKDASQFVSVANKMEEIIDNPFKRYKFLKHDKKRSNRIHIGHYVLIFRIKHKDKLIYFEDFDHHDNIYKLP